MSEDSEEPRDSSVNAREFMDGRYSYDFDTQTWIPFKTVTDALLARLVMTRGLKPHAFDKLLGILYDELNMDLEAAPENAESAQIEDAADSESQGRNESANSTNEGERKTHFLLFVILH